MHDWKIRERLTFKPAGALCRILHGTLVGFFFASSRMNHRQHPGVILSAVVAYVGFFVMWSTNYKIKFLARLILLDFANCLIYYTRKKVTYELLSYEYNWM